MRHDFLLAFVHALQPVFLVGAALAAVAFALAWLLKEVPLRATMDDAAALVAGIQLRAPLVRSRQISPR